MAGLPKGHVDPNEIQNPPLKYSLINREQLIACCGFTSDKQLRKEHSRWVEESIHHNRVKGREPEWTDAIAVGIEVFIDEIRKKLQARQMGRKVRKVYDHY